MAYGSSNPAQEMEYTIAAYKRVQEEYDRITAEIANGGNTDKLTQEQAKLSTELNDIRNNALALYDVINKVMRIQSTTRRKLYKTEWTYWISRMRS